MPEDDVEYFMDDSITIAPAEDIPIDGTGVIQNYEEIQKTTRKRRKRKKKAVKAATKNIEAKAKVATEEPKVEAEVKKAKVKKAVKRKVTKKKKKAVKKEATMEKDPITVDEPKIEIKPETPTQAEQVKVEPEPQKNVGIPPPVQPPVQPPQEASTFKLFGATLLGIIIILAIIFGVGYFGGSDTLVLKDITGKTITITTTESYNYNGHEFGKRAEDGLWYTFVSAGDVEYFIRLHHGPKDVEGIPLVGDIDTSYADAQFVYLTFDPNGNYLNYTAVATGEIGTNFNKAFGLALRGACINNESVDCADRKIITCDNTEEPVVYIKEGSPEKVIMDGNCITIQGEGEGILRSTERLLYNLYGIMR